MGVALRTVTAHQLVYGWRAHGPDGRTGYQVLARSPGFDGRDPQLLAIATRLCEYQGIPGRDLVAYGFTDAAETRFWFRRGPDAPDAFGRSGVFCTHLFAAPCELAPPDAVVTALGTTTWVTAAADATVRDLEAARVGFDVVPGRAPSRDAVELLAAALGAWRHDRRLAVLCDPDALLRLVTEVVTCRPDLWQDRSAVTYLHRRANILFKLAGVARAEDAPAGSILYEPGGTATPRDELVDLAGRLLADRPDDDVDAALEQARAGGGYDIGRLAETYTTLRALHTGTGPNRPALVRLLAEPASAALLAGHPAAVHTLVGFLAAGDTELWAAYHRVRAAWPYDGRADVGAAVFAATEPARVGASYREAMRDPATGAGYVSAAAAAAERDPSLVEAFPVGMVVELFTRCSPGRWTDAAVSRALSDATGFLARPGPDQAVRATVAAQAVIGGDRAVARIVAADRDLVALGAREAMTAGRLVAFADAVASEARDPVGVLRACFVRRAPSSDLVALTTRATQAAEPGRRVDVLVGGVRHLGARTPGFSWAQLPFLAGELAAASLADQAAYTHRDRPLTVPDGLARCLRTMAVTDPDADAWCTLMSEPVRVNVDDVRSRVARCQRLPSAAQQAAGRELVFDSLARRAPHAEALLGLATGVFADSDLTGLCLRILRAGAVWDRRRPAAPAVALQATGLATMRAHRLWSRRPDEEVTRAARRVVHCLDGLQRDSLAAWAADLKGVGWLRAALTP